MGINLANSFGFDAKIGVFGIEPVPHQMRAQVVEMQDTSDFADRHQPPPVSTATAAATVPPQRKPYRRSPQDTDSSR